MVRTHWCSIRWYVVTDPMVQMYWCSICWYGAADPMVQTHWCSIAGMVQHILSYGPDARVQHLLVWCKRSYGPDARVQHCRYGAAYPMVRMHWCSIRWYGVTDPMVQMHGCSIAGMVQHILRASTSFVWAWHEGNA
eukprot:1156114-Pelagomonas_calceolata.AAC.3